MMRRSATRASMRRGVDIVAVTTLGAHKSSDTEIYEVYEIYEIQTSLCTAPPCIFLKSFKIAES